MTVEAVTINNNTVYRDHERTWRWFDAFGPSVAKFTFDASKPVSATSAAG